MIRLKQNHEVNAKLLKKLCDGYVSYINRSKSMLLYFQGDNLKKLYNDIENNKQRY